MCNALIKTKKNLKKNSFFLFSFISYLKPLLLCSSFSSLFSSLLFPEQNNSLHLVWSIPPHRFLINTLSHHTRVRFFLSSSILLFYNSNRLIQIFIDSDSCWLFFNSTWYCNPIHWTLLAHHSCLLLLEIWRT